jgi:ribosomal silencing factor RsfS
MLLLRQRYCYSVFRSGGGVHNNNTAELLLLLQQKLCCGNQQRYIRSGTVGGVRKKLQTLDTEPITKTMKLDKSIQIKLNSILQDDNKITTTDTITTTSSSTKPTWKWIQPNKNNNNNNVQLQQKNNHQPLPNNNSTSTTNQQQYMDIPTRYGFPLEGNEVENGLLANGGMDIIQTTFPPFGSAVIILCTAKSPNHMRTLARLIVSAVKARGLKTFNPSIPIEGEKDDRWMIVDCTSVVVHFFTKESRKEIDLESHFENTRKMMAVDNNTTTITTADNDDDDDDDDDDDVTTQEEIITNEIVNNKN